MPFSFRCRYDGETFDTTDPAIEHAEEKQHPMPRFRDCFDYSFVPQLEAQQSLRQS